MALGHFAFGAVMTSIVVTLLPRVPYPRTVVVAGGVWALLPDIHWITPVGANLLKTFHRAPLADFFWFHHALDGIDVMNSRTVTAVFLGLFILATVIGEYRSYRSPRFIQQLLGREDAINE